MYSEKSYTFEHVINCLVAICEHDELQAEQCALLAHYKGVCEIGGEILQYF